MGTNRIGKFRENESVVILPCLDRYFGLIIHIIENNGKFAFVCKVFRTKRFDLRYQAFQICERDDDFHAVVAPSELIDFSSYSIHTPGFAIPHKLMGATFIVTKVDNSNELLEAVMRKIKYFLNTLSLYEFYIYYTALYFH